MSFSTVSFSKNGDVMMDFERFYLNTKNILYNYLYHHTKDYFELEDLAQETYLVALEQWDMLQNHPNPAGWLILTAKNLNYNYERHVYYRMEGLACPNEIPYIETAYSTVVMEDFFQNVYNEKEQKLAKRYFIDGESVAELSDDFGITQGALRTRIYRMRMRLKSYIESESKVW